MQLFGSGLAFIAKAWAGLVQRSLRAKTLGEKAKLSVSGSVTLHRLCNCTSSSRTGHESAARPRHSSARMNMWLRSAEEGGRNHFLLLQLYFLRKPRVVNFIQASREVLKGLEPGFKSRLLSLFFSSLFLSLFMEKLQHKTRGMLQKQFSNFRPPPTQA